ncbi:MAG: transposase [Paludibacteraceae bacterium]|nr:transposase [Paludibacteraceae bacterium]
MLPDKVRKKISEIETDFSENKLECVNILKGFKALKLTESFSEFKYLKRSGYSFQLVLSSMIYAVTLGSKTAVSSLPLLKEKGITMGKDVLYRLKNNGGINWRKILWQIACKFIGITKGENEGEHKVRCLIFDDTLLEKTGKKIEKIGKVHDHVTDTFKLGYKLLLGLYWDGKSTIPLDFSFLREKGKRSAKPYGMSRKELRHQYSKKRLKELSGKERVEELDKSKIEMMLEIFYRAVFYRIPIDYVLCDSWFTCQALITAVRSKNVHLIGMYRIVKAKFLYRGKLMNYKQINSSIKEITRCRKMRLHYKRADVLLDGMPVTLFFSRQGKRGKWKVFLTTDTKLSFVKLMELYQIRWSIEVFFKETKQLLNLGGCQSNDFDAQIADTTVSMIAYILLSFRYRYEHYESMGELFRVMNAECLQQTLDERLWGLFLELLREICEALEKDIDELFELIMNCPKTAELVSRMLAPPLQEAV